jgi:hypothetical protein
MKPTPKTRKRKKNVATASPPHPRSHSPAAGTGLTADCRHPQPMALPALRILADSAASTMASHSVRSRLRLAFSGFVFLTNIYLFHRYY